jgi:hypothetical protein
MQRLCLTAVVCCLIGVVGASRAAAWNAVGHMAVAKLAYERLSPEERTRLTAVLAEHPHYGQYLSADRPEEIEPGLWAVMRAGVWSDWVRVPRRFEGNPATHPVFRFHRGPWHYVNFPYLAKQSETTLPKKPLEGKTDILQQLSLSAKFAAPGQLTVADPDAEEGYTSAQNRAVRVCWLVHLVGDLHQPLHAATLIDERRLPEPLHDDQGGNLLAVRVEIGAYPVKLHAFWDQILGTDNHPESVVRLTESLQSDKKLATDKLPELQVGDDDFRTWAAESYALAARRAYLDGDLPTTVWNDQKPPLPSVDEVPILPVGYERDAREAARRRVVIASYRLAKLLAAAVK